MQIKKRTASLGAAAAATGLAVTLGVVGLSAAAADPEPEGEGKGPGHRMGFGPPLHGDAVVKKDDAYITVQRQRGEVTAVDESSITVKSEDGFEATYTIDSSTKFHRPGEGAEDGAAKGEVKVGDKAMVAGTKDGDSLTAIMIGVGEPPQAGEGRGKGMRGGGQGMRGGGSGGATPSAQGSAT